MMGNETPCDCEPQRRPPSEWFPGVVEVDGSGVYIFLGHDAADTIVWHWCAGLGHWDGAYITNHAIVSREPLTITASLACRACAWHGFITDGKWMHEPREAKLRTERIEEIAWHRGTGRRAERVAMTPEEQQ